VDAPKKKPGLLLAIGLGKPRKPVADDDSGEDMKEHDDADSDWDSAASAVMDAIKDDDVEGFKAALKAAILSCQDSDSESDMKAADDHDDY
jgi:hypothetical protein